VGKFYLKFYLNCQINLKIKKIKKMNSFQEFNHNEKEEEIKNFYTEEKIKNLQKKEGYLDEEILKSLINQLNKESNIIVIYIRGENNKNYSLFEIIFFVEDDKK
jgi:DNA-binding MurR/RpiR family transcriptional regulator